jgi:TetR/AcrR family transcriptional regulator
VKKRVIGEKRRHNEARILKAAEKVFAERGFEAASTSAIARLAGMPKANLHYYFRTKEALYGRVLEDIIDLWTKTSEAIEPTAEPRQALTTYIARKIEHSQNRPHASKVFANELMHGAPWLSQRMKGDLKAWHDQKCAVLEGWIAEGRMARVDPRHLFFVIWAATQTYADFDVQIRAFLGRRKLVAGDFEAARDLVTRMVLGVCGLR